MSVKYLSLSDPEYAKIESEVLTTYSDACIVWIEENENKELLDKYNRYKESVTPPNEKRLFHGTEKKNIDNILIGGFDPARNKTSAYGKGVYFAIRAVYSKDFSIKKPLTTSRRQRVKSEDDIVYMFVCDVVTGKTTRGSSGATLPKEYDSFTDSVEHPSMYVVNKLEAAYPRYVVAFYPS